MHSMQTSSTFTPTKPRVPIAAMYSSPGPIYSLPSLVGHPNHDTRSIHNRGPAYSIGSKLTTTNDDNSPGPAAYKPPEGYTHIGPDGTPKYTMRGLNSDLKKFQVPGPGTYRPEDTTSVYPRGPDSSFGLKLGDYSKSDIPAPNAYILPKPDITSDKRSLPHYSIRKRNDSMFTGSDAPGPGAYKAIDPDIHLPAAPKHSMGTTASLPNSRNQIPGPGSYRHENVTMHLPGAWSTGISFGIKHSPYKGERLEKPAPQDDDYY